MLRAAYVFPYIVVSLKKDFIGNAVQCWNKYKFLSLEPQDEEGAFIGSEMGELVLKLTMITQRIVIHLEFCTNYLTNRDRQRALRY